jgi:SAM-dependent methyltransferase
MRRAGFVGAKLLTIRRLWRERGVYFILRRSWCRLIYPYWLYRAFFTGRRFSLADQQYRYVYQRYNTAWRNERSVEIAVAAAELARFQGQRVLEVGNVTAHYLPGVVAGTSHTVVDKYEVADGVDNEDVATYDADEFDLIFSISTMEHVGWDESPRDPTKVLRAIDNLKHLVKPGGHLLISVPLSHNPTLDQAIRDGTIRFDQVTYLKRVSQFNTWREVPAETVAGVAYDDPYPGASAICICRWTKGFGACPTGSASPDPVPR